MTPNDVDVLRSAYEALNDGDCRAAVDVLSSDAEWHESSELPDTGTYRGRETIEAFLNEFLESWDRFEQEVEDSRAASGAVLLFLHLSATGKGSGAAVDARYAHLWTMRNGKGVRVDAYYDRDQAIEAFEREAGAEA